MKLITREGQPMRSSATEAVQKRLRVLSEHLRRVTRERLSEEALHELRISCRRAEAALWLCRDATDSRAWRLLRKQLRTLRRACNAARDDDVLQARFKHYSSPFAKHWRRELRTHRKSLQPTIVRLAKELTVGDRFDRYAEKVSRRLRDFESTDRVSFAFGVRLLDELYLLVRSLPADRNDGAALHRLRIVGKRLRYACEIMLEIWPELRLTKLLDYLQAQQDQLGAIHDQQVGQQRLKVVASTRSRNSQRSLQRAMRDGNDRDVNHFWQWWQSYPLEQVISDATTEILTLIRKQD